jgi:hypothetical protein
MRLREGERVSTLVPVMEQESDAALEAEPAPAPAES